MAIMELCLAALEKLSLTNLRLLQRRSQDSMAAAGLSRALVRFGP